MKKLFFYRFFALLPFLVLSLSIMSANEIKQSEREEIKKIIGTIFSLVEKRKATELSNIHHTVSFWEGERMTREEIFETFVKRGLYYHVLFSIPNLSRLYEGCDFVTYTTPAHFAKTKAFNMDDYNLTLEGGIYRISFKEIPSSYRGKKCFLRLPDLVLKKERGRFFIKFLFFFYSDNLVESLPEMNYGESLEGENEENDGQNNYNLFDDLYSD